MRGGMRNFLRICCLCVWHGRTGIFGWQKQYEGNQNSKGPKAGLICGFDSFARSSEMCTRASNSKIMLVVRCSPDNTP